MLIGSCGRKKDSPGQQVLSLQVVFSITAISVVLAIHICKSRLALEYPEYLRQGFEVISLWVVYEYFNRSRFNVDINIFITLFA